MEAFEAQAVRGPEGEVVEPDELVDSQTGALVAPRSAARESAKDPAARVLDAESSSAVQRGAHDEGAVPNSVVQGLEERLRQPVHGHVQEPARAAAARVGEDEERVDRPPDDAVDEKAQGCSAGPASVHRRST